MSIELDQKQGLIAGDGLLPVKMAQYAKENGFDVVCISLSNDNYKQLKKYCSKVYSCHPGEITKIEKIPIIEIIEIGNLTASKLILPKIKQEKFIIHIVNGLMLNRFWLFNFILIQSLLCSISFAIDTNFVSSVSINGYSPIFGRNKSKQIINKITLDIKPAFFCK